MTFEEAARFYIDEPTKKGGIKSEIVRHCLLWMATDKPHKLLDRKTKKLYQYSEKYHMKHPKLSIVYDPTSGRFKDRQMSSIISLDVTKMIKCVRSDKGLGHAGINNYTKYLKALCTYAEESLSVEFPKFPKFPKMLEENRRKEALKPKQVNDLLRWLDPLRADMVRMGLATGLRSSNVRLMRWDWVSPCGKKLHIPAKANKTKKPLTIQLTSTARALLTHRVKARDILLQEHPKLRGYAPALEYVFVQSETRSLGNPFHRSSVTNKTWKRAVRLAGLPSWVRFHSLRHTFATWHIQAGSSTEELMRVGGWLTPSSVSGYVSDDEEHNLVIGSRLEAFHEQLCRGSSR